MHPSKIWKGKYFVRGLSIHSKYIKLIIKQPLVTFAILPTSIHCFLYKSTSIIPIFIRIRTSNFEPRLRHHSWNFPLIWARFEPYRFSLQMNQIGQRPEIYNFHFSLHLVLFTDLQPKRFRDALKFHFSHYNLSLVFCYYTCLGANEGNLGCFAASPWLGPSRDSLI